jgi:hypothetical protein
LAHDCPKVRSHLMAGRESSFPLLDPSDVSYGKLIELEQRLMAATHDKRMSWGRLGDSYNYASPHGLIDVSPAGVTIYDDNGTRLRQFRYETNELFEMVADWYEAMATETIDRVLAELDEGGSA